MYWLEWHTNINNNDILPTCIVHYEQEPYLSEEEQRKEEQIVQRLKEAANIFNEITTKINKEGFPDLCPPNWKDPYKEYPLFVFAHYKELGVLEIECDRIVGGNWANFPPELRGPYPHTGKFWSLLAGFLNLSDEDENTRDKIPLIPVFKIFDDYFCEEGNHRLYVSRCLGLKAIKAEVIEYDYYSLLTKSFIRKSEVQNYLAILNTESEAGKRYASLYPIDEEEMEKYLQLKRKFQIEDPYL